MAVTTQLSDQYKLQYSSTQSELGTVYDHDTVGKWPVHFVDYMAVTLAQRINPSITTSQSTGEALASMKMRMLTTMRARDAQQQPRRRPPRGNWIRALRSGGMTTRS